MNNHINPCICGNKTPSIWYQYHYGKPLVNIKCDRCGKTGKPFRSDKRALKNWNKMTEKRKESR